MSTKKNPLETRPQSASDSLVTTPAAAEMLVFSGGKRSGGVAVTSDEFNRLNRLYGYVDEANKLSQARADAAVFRDATADGLRLVAWLAKHLQFGEDPLKVVVNLAVAAGWDVDGEDAEWARDLGEEEDEEG